MNTADHQSLGVSTASIPEETSDYMKSFANSQIKHCPQVWIWITLVIGTWSLSFWVISFFEANQEVNGQKRPLPTIWV